MKPPAVKRTSALHLSPLAVARQSLGGAAAVAVPHVLSFSSTKVTVDDGGQWPYG
jgi:hypothetical protein